jgi:hypothetical protein
VYSRGEAFAQLFTESGAATERESQLPGFIRESRPSARMSLSGPRACGAWGMRKEKDVMNTCGSITGEVFDLAYLFPKLRTFCIAEIRRFGCPYPDCCGIDALTEYLFDKKGRRAGRIEFDEEKIRINFPETTRQLPVLMTMLKFELLGKRSHCDACKKRKLTCPITDNYPAASNPQAFYEAKEIVDLAASEITNPKDKEDFIKHVMCGFTHTEIAKGSNRTAAAVRKAHQRTCKGLAVRLGKRIFRRKK